MLFVNFIIFVYIFLKSCGPPTADPVLPPPAQMDDAGPGATVWTDGACLHPTDPLLARAGWGLRHDGHSYGGPVGGRQSAQRAEATAVVAATRLVGSHIDLVTDSKYVVRMCVRIANGCSIAEEKHADLWEQVVPAVRSGRLRARLVRAHQNSDAARNHGIAERDCLGNAAADSAAGWAALQRLPPRELVSARLRDLERLEATQRVLAYAQASAVESWHAGRPQSQRNWLRKRDWRLVRRGSRRPKPSGGPADPAATATRPGAVIMGQTLRAFFAGRSWQAHVAVAGPGGVLCLRCARKAQSWKDLADTPCPGWTEDLPAWAQGLLLLGSVCCAGGSTASFSSLAAQRLAQMPAAPD